MIAVIIKCGEMVLETLGDKREIEENCYTVYKRKSKLLLPPKVGIQSTLPFTWQNPGSHGFRKLLIPALRTTGFQSGHIGNFIIPTD